MKKQMAMKNISKITMMVLVPVALLAVSCQDLTELNENPNGVTIESANPNLLMTTVLTETAKYYLDLGFGTAAGVMQHCQKDAWYSSYNNYDWGPASWDGLYSLLRTNQKIYEIAKEKGLEFQEGVSLVMRAFLFAQITDLWGDAPYTHALQGDLGGEENLKPPYDSQETIYEGILTDLKEAAQLLSKDKSEYTGIYEDADVYYHGDPAQWRKFANSLLLRYYMRISPKKDVSADFAQVVNNEPVFESNADDATMSFPGTSDADSWPNNTVFDGTNGSNFRRKKPCATLVETLRAYNDPRVGVWFAKVEIPTVLTDTVEHNTIIDGVRYMNPDSVDLNNVNTNPDYVGYPPCLKIPSAYNYNPTPGQTSYNQFVSYLNDIYKEPSGDLLKARLMSYSEVCFLLAEAAQKGWIGNEQTHYENGVRASLETWGVDDQYDTYIAQPGVAWDGTLEQLMEQKWIASWTAAQEAWFDYRRTGLPALVPGESAKRPVLPLRYMYGTGESNYNTDNYNAALSNLEETPHSRGEIDSPWSKPWLIQGTSKPW
jgi:hypothetical protein